MLRPQGQSLVWVVKGVTAVHSYTKTLLTLVELRYVWDLWQCLFIWETNIGYLESLQACRQIAGLAVAGLLLRWVGDSA